MEDTSLLRLILFFLFCLIFFNFLGDDSNVFWYYECCGTMLSDCCMRIQLWVWIAVAVVVLLLVAGAVLGFLRRRC